MSQNNIDNLVDSLAEDLAPVCRLAHPLLRIAPWIAAAVLYTAGAIAFLGLRPDLSLKMSDPAFLFEVSLMAMMAFSAALASAWMCVPDRRGQGWVVPVPVTLLGVFFLWSFVRSYAEGVLLPPLHRDHCFISGLLMGAVPAAALVFLLRRGAATTCPSLMALMNILAVGGLGYIGLRLTCRMDTVGHACFYQLVSFLVGGAVLGILARRIYRW
ncbi:MAG: DUF1109 domain-containing protein [Alphaproteobacteria bacterium]|nr:DUF1109 domain-containing protein [Alphaproteobacteria bacterium]